MVGFKALAGALFVAAALAAPAAAQDAVADFYRSKQIQMRIGSAAGSGYDLAGRLVAPSLTKYLPGTPAIVVQNVPGAGSLTLANQLYNTAARDGTVLGIVSNGMPTAPLLTPPSASPSRASRWARLGPSWRSAALLRSATASP